MRKRKGTKSVRAPRRAQSSLSAYEAAVLAVALSPYLDRPVEVKVVENRSTMIHVRRTNSACYEVRVHPIFVHAPRRIVRALASYIMRADRASSRALNEYIRARQHLIDNPSGAWPPVSRTLRVRGVYHDLGEIFEALNARYFNEEIEACITWAPQRPRHRPARTIKFGTYTPEHRLIRVHPRLDAPDVPRYVVEFTIYHEMLHATHGVPRVNGRRRFHTDAFLEDEQRFADYYRARRWERENLDRLLAA